MSEQGKVSREIRGQIFLIGLDRAAKRNAFDSHMILDLSAALNEYENHPELRCALIFAHGEHFTAGLDLLELQPKFSQGIFDFSAEQINPWGVSGKKRSKPVVVAVQGICYTAGIELMLNADVVIASADSQFSQMEVQRGIMPFGGATVRFVQAAGWQKAMPYLLTGKIFDAQTADQLNLVSEVVTAGQQFDRALALAHDIAAAAPLAVKALLSSAHEALAQGEAYAFERLNGYLQPLFQSEDVKEGVMAMTQKRPAVFKGK
ncbi:enoyl-CoA hydratase/carnithine racemase [Acinetobacter calcoaceticus]|uniref:Enoyl-CoA hydratase/carnithine racemase n=1 Tax=Acinetobacter calcoaceticus TaxID=471 RepID=A0A4R1XRY7_ACICA|nr:enoyl-CoA hydratase/carnithine racemase [Acinetobacter calcoaceticus]